MKAIEIIDRIKGHKGQNMAAIWVRPAKTLKSCPVFIQKRTEVTIRSGIDYSNLSSVKEGIASGERGEVQPLPWGEWMIFPFVITHKGKEYVRLYPSSNTGQKPKVTWFQDNIEVDYSVVESFLQSSEKRNEDKERPECFTVTTEHVVSLG